MGHCGSKEAGKLNKKVQDRPEVSIQNKGTLPSPVEG